MFDFGVFLLLGSFSTLHGIVLMVRMDDSDIDMTGDSTTIPERPVGDKNISALVGGGGGSRFKFGGEELLKQTMQVVLNGIVAGFAAKGGVTAEEEVVTKGINNGVGAGTAHGGRKDGERDAQTSLDSNAEFIVRET